MLQVARNKLTAQSASMCCSLSHNMCLLPWGQKDQVVLFMSNPKINIHMLKPVHFLDKQELHHISLLQLKQMIIQVLKVPKFCNILQCLICAWSR